MLAQAVQPIADEHGADMAQTVLAWTVSQPGVTSALVGARDAGQVRANAAAGRLKLTGNEQRAIDEAFRTLLSEFAAAR